MTEQLLLRLDVDVIDKLNRLADKYKKKSGNAVAAEIVTTYLEFWEYSEEQKKLTIQKQRELIENMNVPVVDVKKKTRR